MSLATVVDASTVTLVITTRNYARFLGDAFDSALAQTVAPQTVIVVDDASEDDPDAVVAAYADRFADLRAIRTEGRGISAARNAALALVDTTYVVFLDADDVLLPEALSAGLECMADNPGAGLVYGAFQFTDGQLIPRSGVRMERLRSNAYRHLLRSNAIAMHAAVMYDAGKLRACGAFDEGLDRCEDYDVYLRIARSSMVAAHDRLIASYRKHGTNMTRDAMAMLSWHLRVLDKYRPASTDTEEFAYWQACREEWKKTFANAVWRGDGGSFVNNLTQRKKLMQSLPRTSLMAALRQTVLHLLPRSLSDRLRRMRHFATAPAVGEVDFGDLKRTNPISRDFGYLRGTPIDRHYIEAFLVEQSGHIRGRALEFVDTTYIQRFGTGVTQADAVSTHAEHAGATIIGDVVDDDVLPSDTFDCIVMTQVLHLIYDMPRAVRQMHRSLRRDGVALVTVPGVSRIEPDGEGDDWSWALTHVSARRLFAEAFGQDNVEVVVHGNVFAATCFLQGLAVEDVGAEWLDPVDPRFPVTITIVATRRD